jgi:hypothetical protein
MPASSFLRKVASCLFAFSAQVRYWFPVVVCPWWIAWKILTLPTFSVGIGGSLLVDRFQE